MVNVGQIGNKSLHSDAELVPGRSIDTVSFCGFKQDGKLLCDVIIIHGKPINSCIGNQDRMETFSFDVPLLDPTGDFSGLRAPSSFLKVEDVWITNYWLFSQTSYISRLNGFNDQGTPAGREPDMENIHHIDGSKPFLKTC